MIYLKKYCCTINVEGYESIMNKKIILELKGISKRFGSMYANKNINLSIRQGEIHALLGENGAGKSTLMNILAGIYMPDKGGQIHFKGKQVNIKNPCDSIELGIGMVHQHFKLVDTLTVGENILLGHKDLEFWVGKNTLGNKLNEVTTKYNFLIKPNRLVGDLSAGELQRVEIMKLLYRDVDLMILDEPTSVLTPQEIQELFENLIKIKNDGKTIIFISHKLKEVMQIADRVSILRHGEIVKSISKEETNEYEIAQLMVGSEVELFTNEPKLEVVRQEAPIVLEAQNLNYVSPTKETMIKDVSFQLHSSEIFGIAGVSGNGQSQLAYCLTGMSRPTSGQIFVEDFDTSKMSPKELANLGISHIPEDRLGVGSIAGMSSYENAILRSFDRRPIRKKGLINKKQMKKYGKHIFEKYDVRMTSPEMPIRFLSGGNVQKLILGREIEEKPKIIVAVHPTYGLDFASVEKLHQILIEKKQQGCGIILISEDLDELFRLSDRIAVMYKGEMREAKKTINRTRAEVGYEMMGIAGNNNTKEDIAL